MRMHLAIAAVCVLFVGSASAGVFRCQVNGETVYSDKPCADDAEEVRVHRSPDMSAPSGLRPGEVAEYERIRLEELVARRRVAVGMTPDQVTRSWGTPNHVNRTVTALGVREQWVYDRGRTRAQYVYITDGKVSSLSDSE